MKRKIADIKWGIILSFILLAVQGVAQNRITFEGEDIRSNNPFKNLAYGLYSSPTFGDIDNDGDDDLVVGYKGGIGYFENVGDSYVFHTRELDGASFPFPNIHINPEDLISLDFADYNHDGKLNCIYSDGKDLTIVYPQSTGEFNQSSKTLKIFEGGHNSIYPKFADLNGDENPDLISHEYYGEHRKYNHFFLFENKVPREGNNLDNPFTKSGKNILYDSLYMDSILTAPAFADLDRDGDLDMLSGDVNGQFHYFENIGTAYGAHFKHHAPDSPINPFYNVDIGAYSSPTFFDYDYDGDMDLFSGAKDGQIHFFENTTDELVAQSYDDNYRWRVLNTGDFKGTIESMATDNEGNVYVGGDFDSIGGISVDGAGVARWEKESGEWKSFNTSFWSFGGAQCKKVVFDSILNKVYFAVHFTISKESTIYSWDPTRKFVGLQGLEDGAIGIESPVTDLMVNNGEVYATYGELDLVNKKTSKGLLLRWKNHKLAPDTLYSNPKAALQSVVMDSVRYAYFTEVEYDVHEKLNGSYFFVTKFTSFKFKETKDVYSHCKMLNGPLEDVIFLSGVNKNLSMAIGQDEWINGTDSLHSQAYGISVPIAVSDNDLFVVSEDDNLLDINHYEQSNNFLPETVERYNKSAGFTPVIKLLHTDSDKNLYKVVGVPNSVGDTIFRIVKHRKLAPVPKPKLPVFKYSANSLAKLDGKCNSLVTDQRGNLYAGGEFRTVDLDTMNYITKWDDSRKEWISLGSFGFNAPCEVLKLDWKGNLIAGGEFTQVDDDSIQYIAKWNPNTESWSSIGKGNELLETCNAIAFDTYGKLYVGGGGQRNNGYVAYWDDTTWNFLPNNVNWKNGWSVENILFDKNGDLLIEVQGEYFEPGYSTGEEMIAVLKWSIEEQKYEEKLIYSNNDTDLSPGGFCKDFDGNYMLTFESEGLGKVSDTYLLSAGGAKPKQVESAVVSTQFTSDGSNFYGISPKGLYPYTAYQGKKIVDAKNTSVSYDALTGNMREGFYTATSSTQLNMYSIEKIAMPPRRRKGGTDNFDEDENDDDLDTEWYRFGAFLGFADEAIKTVILDGKPVIYTKDKRLLIRENNRWEVICWGVDITHMIVLNDDLFFATRKLVGKKDANVGTEYNSKIFKWNNLDQDVKMMIEYGEKDLILSLKMHSDKLYVLLCKSYTPSFRLKGYSLSENSATKASDKGYATNYSDGNFDTKCEIAFCGTDTLFAFPNGNVARSALGQFQYLGHHVIYHGILRNDPVKETVFWVDSKSATQVVKTHWGNWSKVDLVYSQALNGSINDIQIDPTSGDIYAVGSFTATTRGSEPLNGIARWDGENWHAVGSFEGGAISSIAIDEHGKLVVIGKFTKVDGQKINGVTFQETSDKAVWRLGDFISIETNQIVTQNVLVDDGIYACKNEVGRRDYGDKSYMTTPTVHVRGKVSISSADFQKPKRLNGISYYDLLVVEGGIATENIGFGPNPRQDWKDSVFATNYPLKSLDEYSQFIDEHGHLPGIPSEDEVREEGYSLHQINVVLLEKIEELALYLIQQEKFIKDQKEKVEQLKVLLDEQNKVLEELENFDSNASNTTKSEQK